VGKSFDHRLLWHASLPGLHPASASDGGSASGVPLLRISAFMKNILVTAIPNKQFRILNTIYTLKKMSIVGAESRG
jgi:hypothetical protein